jgi:hypothetical protein
VKVNLLGDERAAAGQDPGDLSRAERLVPAGDQVERAVTERQPAAAVFLLGDVSAAPSSWTTAIPSGRNRAAATGTLGGHASVATVCGGRGDSRDSRSPPPVPMSSMALAAAARRTTSRR